MRDCLFIDIGCLYALINKPPCSLGRFMCSPLDSRLSRHSQAAPDLKSSAARFSEMLLSVSSGARSRWGWLFSPRVFVSRSIAQRKRVPAVPILSRQSLVR
jgi:hypothetical protein